MLTSPPYPMIEMWDKTFSEQNPLAGQAIELENGQKAFDLMHKILDSVWDEVYRVVKPGGFACINIGDATRTLKGDFVLYSNHSRILNKMLKIGFTSLPCILWRKQTNAPNKFMGSGMLPAGAYVTLEHEYILIFRKGSKREFINEEDKRRRRQSAIFWDERNRWYSDVWFDIKGTLQALNKDEARKRSAAYPFELAYRLISMYSVKGDVILDPFLGTGTTTLAAITSCRNSIGFEIDDSLKASIENALTNKVDFSNEYIMRRVDNYLSFLKERIEQKKPIKYLNSNYNFPVVTSQEQELLINEIKSIQKVRSDLYEATYSEAPQDCLILRDSETFYLKGQNIFQRCIKTSKDKNQLSLF
jgi:DNA modification methylase